MEQDQDIQERIEVLHDSLLTFKTILEIFSNAKDKWDYCGDIRSLSVIFSNEATKKEVIFIRHCPADYKYNPLANTEPYLIT